MNVKFNDQHIPDSPFRVQVVPGSQSVFPQPDTGQHNSCIVIIDISELSPYEQSEIINLDIAVFV